MYLKRISTISERRSIGKSYFIHKLNSDALIAGLEAMELKMIAPTQYLLLELITVYIAEGINDLTVRKALLNQYGIEIGGGLGEFKGKVRRMGLMGYSSRKENVILLLA